MGVYAQLLDALGEKADAKHQVIEAGTLRVTRGTALVSVVVLGVASTLNAAGVDFVEELPAWQKWTGALVIAGIWGLVTAADGIARAIATIGTTQATTSKRAATAYSQALDFLSHSPENVAQDFHVISPPVPVRRQGLLGTSSELGWTVVGSGLRDAQLNFLVVKGNEVAWVCPQGLTWKLDKASEKKSPE